MKFRIALVGTLLFGCSFESYPHRMTLVLESSPTGGDSGGPRNGPDFSAFNCAVFSFSSSQTADQLSSAKLGGYTTTCTKLKGFVVSGTKAQATGDGLKLSLPEGTYDFRAFGVVSGSDCTDIASILAKSFQFYEVATGTVSTSVKGKQPIPVKYTASAATEVFSGCRPGDVSTWHRAFVTSQTFPASQGGLAATDAKCQTAASMAGLAGTWKAITSGDAISVKTRLTITGSVYNLRPVSAGGPQLLANDSADLWKGSIAAPVRYTELGIPVSRLVWTGSDRLGQAVRLSCYDFFSTSLGDFVNVGVSDANGYDWIATDTISACNNNFSFYCISQ